LQKFILILFFAAAFAAITCTSTAQITTDKLPDELPKDLNQEQWELVRDLYAVDAIKLLAKMDTLQLQIDSLEALNEYYENFDCEAELYAIVGATKEEVADYRRKFDEAENYITARKNQPDDASRNYFSSLSGSKIKCLPEFQDRYRMLKEIAENFVPKNNDQNNNAISSDEYIVLEGDNLSSLSLKFYGTSSKWYLIWEANKREIEDPDFVYPGQIVKIPQFKH